MYASNARVLARKGKSFSLCTAEKSHWKEEGRQNPHLQRWKICVQAGIFAAITKWEQRNEVESSWKVTRLSFHVVLCTSRLWSRSALWRYEYATEELSRLKQQPSSSCFMWDFNVKHFWTFIHRINSSRSTIQLISESLPHNKIFRSSFF